MGTGSVEPPVRHVRLLPCGTARRNFLARDHLGVKPLYYAWPGIAGVRPVDHCCCFGFAACTRSRALAHLECQYIRHRTASMPWCASFRGTVAFSARCKLTNGSFWRPSYIPKRLRRPKRQSLDRCAIEALRYQSADCRRAAGCVRQRWRRLQVSALAAKHRAMDRYVQSGFTSRDVGSGHEKRRARQAHWKPSSLRCSHPARSCRWIAGQRIR